MKPVTDYENLYRITEDGQVISNKLGRAMATSVSNAGYLQVALYKEGIGKAAHIHRLVALHYLSPVEGKTFVNHKDGNKHNNHVSNLEWVTKSENAIHAIETGLVVRPRRLSEEETLVVLKDFLDGSTLTELVSKLPIKLPRLSVQIRKVAKKYGLLDQYVEQTKKAHVERMKARWNQ